MNARMLACLLILLPGLTFAQGFAGLGTGAEGFAQPRPNPQFDFPADHGPHPQFRIEWWYVTANLEAPDGTEYGAQWTLFRTALAPGEDGGWSSPQLWMGHAAVTTPTAHFAAERLARGGIGQAGVEVEPFSAWIDEWALKGSTVDELQMRAHGPDFGYEIRLDAQGPIVFHGAGGYSVKSAEGQASYYYSQPFYMAEGILLLPEGEVPVTGMAWLDREWSSQPLAANQSGWDWFSLSFESGEKLMGFSLRQADGTNYTSATWIAPDGTTKTYPDAVLKVMPLEMAEVAGRDIPVHWRVILPDQGLDVRVEAVNEAAWMATSVPYWEGPVRVSGSHEGRGYLEMTGYE